MAVAFAPHVRAFPEALRFAAERAGWLEARLAELPPNLPLEPGRLIPLRGEDTLLVQAPGRAPAFLEPDRPPRFMVPTPGGARFAARAEAGLRRLAAAALEEEVARAATILGVAPRRIVLKDMRSRWGSCTSERVLTFSWRVICAPPAVLAYLAAHEVAHLVEMNHSKRFWAQVRRCRPDYAAERAWLRRHGALLQAVGR